MEMKKIIKEYLSNEGTREGKINILRFLLETEKELANEPTVRRLKLGHKEPSYRLSDWFVDQGLPTKDTIVRKLQDIKKSISEPHGTNFEIHDPVKCRVVGTWDRFLTKERTYIVHEITDECIIIKDDSGDLNPYLKDRFINLSKRNLKAC